MPLLTWCRLPGIYSAAILWWRHKLPPCAIFASPCGGSKELCRAVRRPGSSTLDSTTALVLLFLSLCLGIELDDLSAPSCSDILNWEIESTLVNISTRLAFWWIYLQGWIRFIFLCLQAKETYVFKAAWLAYLFSMIKEHRKLSRRIRISRSHLKIFWIRFGGLVVERTKRAWIISTTLGRRDESLWDWKHFYLLLSFF